MQELITIHGYWKDTKEPITRLCMVDSRVDPHHKDHQQFLREVDSDERQDDDAIFYYLEPNEKIIGDWGDIVVYKFEVEGELL